MVYLINKGDMDRTHYFRVQMRNHWSRVRYPVIELEQKSRFLWLLIQFFAGHWPRTLYFDKVIVRTKVCMDNLVFHVPMKICRERNWDAHALWSHWKDCSKCIVQKPPIKQFSKKKEIASFLMERFILKKGSSFPHWLSFILPCD